MYINLVTNIRGVYLVEKIKRQYLSGNRNCPFPHIRIRKENSNEKELLISVINGYDWSDYELDIVRSMYNFLQYIYIPTRYTM